MNTQVGEQKAEYEIEQNAQVSFGLQGHNPDVLTCIANLSNDEVFTPPKFANNMLDAVAAAWAEDNGGANLWADKSARFLDPFTKSGIFLREITTRLTVGLESEFPDLQERVDHILTKQVYGIGITNLTSLLARRSVYCSKFANGKHSVAKSFETEHGNIWFERTEHTWAANNKCTYCNASKEAFDRGPELETHAYAFIHTDNVQNRIGELFGGKMQFDVIVGNPPYQIEADASGQNIVPIYNKFVEQAKALSPRYISMVIPSRWMAGGRLDEFRARILADRSIRTLVDYPNAAEAFPGVDIKGGVCYFLWNHDQKGSCAVTTKRGDVTIGPTERDLNEFDVFVRDSRSLSILRRILSRAEPSLADIVSTRDPFGPALSSNFSKYHATKKPGDLWLYINQQEKRGETWVNPSVVTRNEQLVDRWKVLMPKAGPGNSGGHVIPDMVLSKPLIAEPGSVCTLSYIVIGPLNSKEECESLAAYLRTRFARFIVSLRKPSQDAPRGVYTWVPQQTWDREWSDDELYAKYEITPEEQAYIAEMIRAMSD